MTVRDSKLTANSTGDKIAGATGRRLDGRRTSGSRAWRSLTGRPHKTMVCPTELMNDAPAIEACAKYNELIRRGQTRVVEFTLAPRQFALDGADGRLTIQPGTFDIAVGAKQPGFTGPADAVTSGVVSSVVTLNGAAKQVE